MLRVVTGTTFCKIEKSAFSETQVMGSPFLYYDNVRFRAGFSRADKGAVEIGEDKKRLF